ncbi:MAG: hypothetical protein R2706_16465 [Acidimicrobiales bacterium]
MEVSLWIEAEHLAEDITDFCNVVVAISTGERYQLNVWSSDFYAMAWADGEPNASEEVRSLYMLPPDLFVADLTRPTIETAVADLIINGRMPKHCLVPDEVLVDEAR